MQPVLVEALVRSQLPETFLYIFNSLVGKCRAGQGTKPLCHCEPTGCANARPTTGSAKPRSVFSRHSGARVRRANPEIYRAATILEKWLSGPAFRGASMNDETLDCFGAHAPLRKRLAFVAGNDGVWRDLAPPKACNIDAASNQTTVSSRERACARPPIE